VKDFFSTQLLFTTRELLQTRAVYLRTNSHQDVTLLDFLCLQQRKTVASKKHATNNENPSFSGCQVAQKPLDFAFLEMQRWGKCETELYEGGLFLKTNVLNELFYFCFAYY